MTGPIEYAKQPPAPTAGNAAWVNITWTDGTPNITSSGDQSPFPTLEYLDATAIGVPTNQSVTAGVLSISNTGNRTTRVFGNAVIDRVMRLDQFSGGNTVKFFATRLYRGVTAMTGNERIFQYGDQGSSASQTGGWVLRINSSNSATGKINCATAAVHWPDPYGTLAEDLVTFNAAGTDVLNADNGAYTSATGHLICQAVIENYSGSNHACLLFIDDFTQQTDTDTNGFPLPGISTITPVNDAASAGFTLFAQSVNDGTAILKDTDVWPIWIGEARDLTQLNSILANLKTDITANPY